MPYIAHMKAYFFDLDGTLTDSRAGLYPAFRSGLEAIGVSSVADEQLKRFLGTPLPQVFRAMRPDVKPADIDAGITAFRATYEVTGIVENELYPGVNSMLGEIRRRHGKIWVVTSKPEFQAVRVTAHLGLDHYLEGVIGASLAETDTKTELIARALSAARVPSHTAIMIGDRSYDVVGAIANRVLPVGALWGYGSEDELREAGCREFARSPDEFREVFVQARPSLSKKASLAAAGAR
ncbi:HAD hydrolase-like protein [Bradyrhizobium erythrophlei]|uniref:HAD hydrolase-like protein n=1 Tax=Bradyrhizobium erythrophlei TaxID=1437360 RepID=UPI0035E76D4C